MLALVCVPILHKISLRDRSTFGTAGITIFKYNRSHQIPLIRSQLPRNSNTRCTEHATPSLVFHHPCNSRSSLHTIWREENRSTRSFVMSHIDTAQQSLVSSSKFVVLTDWTFPSLSTSTLIRRSTIVHDSVPGHTIRCMTWHP